MASGRVASMIIDVVDANGSCTSMNTSSLLVRRLLAKRALGLRVPMILLFQDSIVGVASVESKVASCLSGTSMNSDSLILIPIV
jgi:hypothetical protein